MPDTIQSIKVNGTSYSIDYESLANRPCYSEETLGEALLSNATVTSGENNGSLTTSPLEADVTAGEWLRFTFDGTAMDLYCDVIDNGTTTQYLAAGDAALMWTKTGSTYGDLTIMHPDITAGSGKTGLYPTYTVSLQRLEKDAKVLSADLNAAVFPYFASIAMVGWAPKGLTVKDCAAGVWSDALSFSGMGQSLYYPVQMAVEERNGVIVVGEVVDGSPATTVTGGLWYNPNTGACKPCTNLNLLTASHACTTYDITEGADAGEYTDTDFIGSLVKSGTGTPGMIVSASSDNAGSGQNTWTLMTAETVVYDGDGNVVASQFGTLTISESTGQFTYTPPQ